jgi:hypothetical protein
MSSRKEFEVVMRRWFRNAAGAATPVSAVLPLVLDAVQIVQNEMIRRDVASVRESQRRSDELLSALSEHTREFEESTSRALQEQTERLAELRTSTGVALLVTAARAREDVLRERRERLRDIDRLDVAVGALVEDRDRARDAAERWLADARTLCDVIAATLPHEDYQPRALADVEARLAIVADNLDQGLPGPALSLAQEAYQTLSDLRLDLELRHREWLAGRWEAVRGVTIVKELISHARLLPAVDLVPAHLIEQSGQGDPGEVELDRQSTARLSELDGEAGAILASLQDGAARLTIDEVRDLITSGVPRLQEQVEQTIAVGWQRLQAAQVRANLADLMAEILEVGFLYRTERAGYDEEDPSGSFTARLRQPMSENEIVLHVRPVGDGVAATQVEIESIAQSPESDQVRRERAAAITRYLRDQGFEVGEPAEAGPRALTDGQERAPEAAVVPKPAPDEQARADPQGQS